MDQVVEAARPGDEAAFAQVIEPLRHELQIHCYRMLGSIEDAEDAVQETFLRAWTRRDSYAGRAPFRAWLYGIATHACLDALRRKKARMWPTDLAGPADPRNYALAALDVPWLQPYPDRLLDAAAAARDEPEAVVTAKETIELAFLAAIQRLPARQRAVLVLRDTLDWSVRDTAAALNVTQAAVNSALQRAHATLAAHLPQRRAEWRSDPTVSERRALERLIAAWERGDAAALVELLSDDAKLIMPPGSTWFAGRRDIATFLAEHVFGQMSAGWRLLPTAANRQPAFGLYWRRPGDDVFRAFAIGVLRVDGDAIGQIALFQQPELFGAFALAPCR
ncbi:RNA polymerase subunit sigma-70 [Actinocrinis puniceicyclus]|uniref:RNA polymerase subunit sigma-70 n=1 Tax=Actinocrinis puniceicyclus TaxID=977794 RepID=A0A8J7WQ42_9ACTN|nr:RNA polymerase subunit sigma-70 [Actinocrinis puniceicyclus]MBS2964287.1 RNA polymerase subunit sigma-70 [Actinocrinis puniceicyclus]